MALNWSYGVERVTRIELALSAFDYLRGLLLAALLVAAIPKIIVRRGAAAAATSP
jgi:predicted hydrolase (HD superfamily)